MEANWVIGLVLVLMLLPGFFFGGRYKADLSSPRLWRRWLNRAVLYPWFHLIAAVLLMHLGNGLSALRPELGEGLQDLGHGPAGFVLLPFPLAVVLMTIPVRLQRVLRGRRWKPGPDPEPVVLPQAVAAIRPRSRDYGHIDLADPAMIEELARSHWQVMDAADRRGLGLDHAERMQRGFLRYLLLLDDRQLAEQAASVYRRAMIAHAWDGQRERGL